MILSVAFKLYKFNLVSWLIIFSKTTLYNAIILIWSFYSWWKSKLYLTGHVLAKSDIICSKKRPNPVLDVDIILA